MDTDSTRRGQAAVEFVIGLLVLVTIVAGGIQYLRVANAHRNITTTLRAEAGERALRDDLLVSIPHYLDNWDAGDDATRHTDDDRPVRGSAGVLNQVASRSVVQPADWDTLAPLNHSTPMEQLRLAPMPMVELGFIKAERSDRIMVDQAVRELIYDRPYVTVRHTVWMPQLGGLY